MAACATCGTTILFGGVQDAGMRFCNANCHSRGSLLRIAQQIPPDVLQQQTWAVHHGACPKCQGPGPVDVHKSYRIWSIVFLTSWSNTPRVSCKRCGVKGQLGDALFCLFLGWWGFPWGLVMTPVQIVRNLTGVFRASSPTGPSPDLERAVGLAVAATAARRS
ncbi:MAG TPA: hypothetical protein VN605_08550 [Thermoanaerobaculia bacterium]|nr:hypothetical protein [Thermoanaerobaculia bacterium]